jgi:hypothetical protein
MISSLKSRHFKKVLSVAIFLKFGSFEKEPISMHLTDIKSHLDACAGKVIVARAA